MAMPKHSTSEEKSKGPKWSIIDTGESKVDVKKKAAERQTLRRKGYSGHNHSPALFDSCLVFVSWSSYSIYRLVQVQSVSVSVGTMLV